jgi:hypothetical protein
LPMSQPARPMKPTSNAVTSDRAHTRPPTPTVFRMLFWIPQARSRIGAGSLTHVDLVRFNAGRGRRSRPRFGGPTARPAPL